MITAPTTSFYMVKAEGEAAENLAADISPSAAGDIASAIIVSADFEVDIMAINNMRTAIDRLKLPMSAESLTIDEKFNPLYLPAPMEAVDEMLVLDARADGIRFVGMQGNPFTLVSTEITAMDEPIISGTVQYRSFEVPSYSEIVADRSSKLVN